MITPALVKIGGVVIYTTSAAPPDLRPTMVICSGLLLMCCGLAGFLFKKGAFDNGD